MELLCKLENKSRDLLAEKELMLDLHSNFRSIKEHVSMATSTYRGRERARIP